jgi:hypothetical protein
MSAPKTVTPRQATLAFIVAIAADLLQLPMTLGYVSVVAAVPSEVLDAAIDTLTAVFVSRLLGFHWALLPTFAIEAIPFADAAPTWTGCVAYVVHRRKQQGVLIADQT